jgi:hypothetical protein
MRPHHFSARVLMHNASNTMFYMVVWMAPERNCAVIVATNTGAKKAFAGCDETAGKLIQHGRLHCFTFRR